MADNTMKHPRNTQKNKMRMITMASNKTRTSWRLTCATMGASAIKAAQNLHTRWGVPYQQIAVTLGFSQRFINQLGL